MMSKIEVLVAAGCAGRSQSHRLTGDSVPDPTWSSAWPTGPPPNQDLCADPIRVRGFEYRPGKSCPYPIYTVNLETVPQTLFQGVHVDPTENSREKRAPSPMVRDDPWGPKLRNHRECLQSEKYRTTLGGPVNSLEHQDTRLCSDSVGAELECKLRAYPLQGPLLVAVHCKSSDKLVKRLVSSTRRRHGPEGDGDRLPSWFGPANFQLILVTLRSLGRDGAPFLWRKRGRPRIRKKTEGQIQTGTICVERELQNEIKNVGCASKRDTKEQDFAILLCAPRVLRQLLQSGGCIVLLRPRRVSWMTAAAYQLCLGSDRAMTFSIGR